MHPTGQHQAGPEHSAAAPHPGMAPEAAQFDDAAAGGASGRPGVRGMLGDLFPVPAVAPPRAAGRRLLSVVAQVVAVGLGAVLLLERIPGLPSWDTIYGEDYWEFGTQALQAPWHVFSAFGGYDELLPRVIAQLATYLPLGWESRWDAVSGAVIAAGCGLFVFHASAGQIRSMPLRALLGASIVLMPIASMEIADSAVGTPWYLMLATFWALLWRPRTRTGMVIAAIVVFAASSSEVVSFLFLPLVVARLIALPRWREHVVTVGWLAGCLVQVPGVLSSYFSGQSRLNRQQGTLGHSLAFYAHDTVLPSLGWHVAWWLQALAGKNGATAIVAVILAVTLGAILVAQPGNRPFVVACVLVGFVFSVFETTLTPNVATYPVVAFDLESGSRYSVLPIFLLVAAVVVGVDSYVARHRPHRRQGRSPSLRPALAVSALFAVLAFSWVADFRNPGFRSDANWNWGQITARWEHACQLSTSGEITVKAGATFQTLPCARMRT
jgi:hypothetical protein